MKNLTGFVLASLIILTFTSCANKDENSSDSGFPTGIYSEENPEELGFEQLLYFGPVDDYYRGEEDELLIISFIEPVEWEFLLNAQEVDFAWENYDGRWEVWIEYEDLEDIDFSPGENINYYLSVNDKSYQGELKMPDEFCADWPEFDFNEDFEFNWYISENPHIYNIICEGYIEEDKSDYEFYECWQIEGDENEYSISQSTYTEYDNLDDFEIDISIYAINYMNHGNFLVWTEMCDYFGYYNGDKSTQKQIDPRKKIWQMIEMFQQKFN